MKILLSPAKKITLDDKHGLAMTVPRFQEQSVPLLETLQNMDYPGLKALYKVSDAVARPVYDHLQALKQGRETEKYPALLAFSGIAYRYMAPGVFTDEMMQYVSDHLLILSGLYGALSPLDGITPYRLEMGTRGPFDLYAWWKKPLQNLFAGYRRSHQPGQCRVRQSGAAVPESDRGALSAAEKRQTAGNSRLCQNGPGRHGPVDGRAPGADSGGTCRI